MIISITKIRKHEHTRRCSGSVRRVRASYVRGGGTDAQDVLRNGAKRCEDADDVDNGDLRATSSCPPTRRRHPTARRVMATILLDSRQRATAASWASAAKNYMSAINCSSTLSVEFCRRAAGSTVVRMQITAHDCVRLSIV